MARSCGLWLPSVIHGFSSALLASQSAGKISHTTLTFSRSFPLSYTHMLACTHSSLTMCHNKCDCHGNAHTNTHMQCPHSVPWLTRWLVLSLGHGPIRYEDTNLSLLVMLKATGHYLLAISALTTQTERATRLPDTTVASAFECVFHEPTKFCYRKCDGRRVINYTLLQ